MFFNDLGDECGGLIYAAKKKEDGSISSGMSITMDRYRDDQVVQLLNSEYIKNGKVMAERGLIINDFLDLEGLNARNKAFSEAEKIYRRKNP